MLFSYIRNMQNTRNLKKNLKAAWFFLRPVETRCVHKRHLQQGFYQIPCEKGLDNNIFNTFGWSLCKIESGKLVLGRPAAQCPELCQKEARGALIAINHA